MLFLFVALSFAVQTFTVVSNGEDSSCSSLDYTQVFTRVQADAICSTLKVLKSGGSTFVSFFLNLASETEEGLSFKVGTVCGSNDVNEGSSGFVLFDSSQKNCE
jgi:hypothetical protein